MLALVDLNSHSACFLYDWRSLGRFEGKIEAVCMRGRDVSIHHLIWGYYVVIAVKLNKRAAKTLRPVSICSHISCRE